VRSGVISLHYGNDAAGTPPSLSSEWFTVEPIGAAHLVALRPMMAHSICDTRVQYPRIATSISIRP
jgi:hypothetical protein